MKNAATFSALAFAAGAAAHGGVYFYKLDGVDYEGYHPYNPQDGQSSIQRVWDTHDPILSADSPFTACNTAGITNQGQQRAAVTAGSEVQFTYNKDWDHDTGPISVYLAKCGDSCDDVNVNELDFFKIATAGLFSGTLQNGRWANGKMMEDGWTFKFTLPASIEDGAYLLRSEQITLHNLPAQIYPQCAHIDIKGGGGVAVPSEFLVKFPGAYSQADVDVDIWTSSSTEYAIPGPQVYAGSTEAPAPAPEPTETTSTPEADPTSSEEPEPEPTSSQEPEPVPTSTEDEPEPTTDVPAPSEPAPPVEVPSSSSEEQSVPTPQPTEQPTVTEQPPTSSTTDSAPGATQTKWGQCAGKIWDGATACAEGNYCEEINEWYSQCVPNDYTEPKDGELWGKCGGRGHRGSRRCPQDAQCVRINRWYSECQPLEDSE